MAEFKYTAADFKSDQEVRWCPGCGDHANLNAVQIAVFAALKRHHLPHVGEVVLQTGGGTGGGGKAHGNAHPSPDRFYAPAAASC